MFFRPFLRLLDLVPKEEPQKTMKILMKPRLQVNPDPPKKKILIAQKPKTNTEPKKPAVCILPRKTNTTPSKSLEEREEDYAKARARIFNDGEPIDDTEFTKEDEETPTKGEMTSNIISENPSIVQQQDLEVKQSEKSENSISNETNSFIPSTNASTVQHGESINIQPSLDLHTPSRYTQNPNYWNGNQSFPQTQFEFGQQLPNYNTMQQRPIPQPYRYPNSIPNSMQFVQNAPFIPQYTYPNPPLDNAFSAMNLGTYQQPHQPVRLPLMYNYTDLPNGSPVVPAMNTPPHILEISPNSSFSNQSLSIFQKYEDTIVKQLGNPIPTVIICKSSSHANYIQEENTNNPHFSLIQWSGRIQ